MEDNENIENINKEPDASTSSWVFVENESEPNQSEEYQSNETSCVQELNEDDLGSTSCDSDGISVISESECFLHEVCTCIPKITSNDEDNDEALNHITDEQTSLDKDTITVIKETEVSNEPVSTNQLIETNKQVNTSNSINSTNSGVLTFASTVAGVCIVITYLISNYNTTTNDVTIDDFDEMYDMHLWTNYDDNETCDLNNDLIELNTDINNLVETYDVIKQQSDTINLPARVSNVQNEKAINQLVNKEKPTNVNKRDKHISRNLNNNKKVKTKISKNYQNEKIQTEHLKQLESYLKKKEKYLTKREKYIKKIEKHIINLEARFRKLFNRMRKNKENDKIQSKKLKNNGTKTGEWYEKLSFGRSEIRHKEKLSDWMFERSKMRNKLRDKAHWYFNRANGREEYRSSEHVRSGKRNYFKTYRY